MHEQMFRSGGQSHVKPPSVKFPRKLGTPFFDRLKVLKADSTLPSPGFEPQTCGVEVRFTKSSATGLQIYNNYI
ncbi:hypothetical protein TNCV_333371 [Trichonephila clavipes]|nr:hypothetical protein TNCV_333371 [Trichonephila clavipes]